MLKRDSRGRTALHWATSNQGSEIPSEFLAPELLLLQSENGATPFEEVVKNGSMRALDPRDFTGEYYAQD